MLYGLPKPLFVDLEHLESKFQYKHGKTRIRTWVRKDIEWWLPILHKLHNRGIHILTLTFIKYIIYQYILYTYTGHKFREKMYLFDIAN